MFAVGVGWNLAYSGGSALISAAYHPAERNRVQPIAELVIIGAQVTGALSATSFTSPPGWQTLGWLCVMFAGVVASVLLLRHRRRPTPGPST